MKILVPIYPWADCGYPAKFIPGGLLGALLHQVPCLVKLGHEVTLLTSRNFPVTTTEVKQIACDFPSKEEKGTTSWQPFTEAICSHGDKFDIILCHFPELKLNKEAIRGKVRGLAPKFRVILHHYDETPFSTFFVTQYQVMAFILQHGGRVGTVSSLFSDYCRGRFEKDPKVITKNPYHIPELPTTDFSEKFEYLNTIRAEVDMVPKVLRSNGDFVMAGRPSVEKNLLVGVKAYCKAQPKGNLHIFTYTPYLETKPKNLEYFDQLMAYESERIIFHLKAPREELYATLAESSVLIFPSKKEASPLVPQEAASCGLNVVYAEPHVHYLYDSDVRVPNYSVKSFAEGLQTVSVPTIEEKERKRESFLSSYGEKPYSAHLTNFLQPR